MSDITQEVRFELTASDDVRSGRYSNLQRVSSNPSETIIDFCLLDSEAPGDDGAIVASGMIQSRIILSNQKFVELYQLMKQHIEQNFTVADSDD